MTSTLKLKLKFTIALLAFTGIHAVNAAMITKTIDYQVDGKSMQSVLVYDDAVKALRPGLVMTPDWLGMNSNQVTLAKQIASKDYVILVADVYGTAVRPTTPTEAGAASQSMYEHRSDLRARINAALAQLKSQVGKAPLDGQHWGAFGFCFGGAATLDLARTGADVQAVVSFHGNLATDDPALAKNIKAKVLAMNGGDDKYVPDEQIVAFQKEMRDANVDWQFVSFGGAVHCFAIPTAHGEVPGCQYNERAAKRSLALMHGFLAESFATKQ
jgi:dienelactone hydrolase